MTKPTVNEFYPVTINNVRLYRLSAFDAYPDLAHAIFTRHGGVSRSPYHTLNVGSSVGDDAEAVQQNIVRTGQALGITSDQAVTCYQVHSATVLTVTGANRQSLMGRADGLVTTEPSIYLTLRFADCTPLLFYDPFCGAVGLAHAGWRGTAQNMAGAVVAAMVKLGCRPQNIIAAIGPAIGPCCYEVGPEVIETVAANVTDSASLFNRHNGRPGHAHFDLWAANQRQLAASGVGRIIETRLCTACHRDEFFSHRAEAGRTGRFAVMIGLRGAAG